MRSDAIPVGRVDGRRRLPFGGGGGGGGGRIDENEKNWFFGGVLTPFYHLIIGCRSCPAVDTVSDVVFREERYIG